MTLVLNEDGSESVGAAAVDTHFDQYGEPLPEQPYYCPGCGKRSKYPRECTGLAADKPHPPIEMIETDELAGDPSNHTAAPSTDDSGRK